MLRFLQKVWHQLIFNVKSWVGFVSLGLQSTAASEGESGRMAADSAINTALATSDTPLL